MIRTPVRGHASAAKITAHNGRRDTRDGPHVPPRGLRFPWRTEIPLDFTIPSSWPREKRDRGVRRGRRYAGDHELASRVNRSKRSRTTLEAHGSQASTFRWPSLQSRDNSRESFRGTGGRNKYSSAPVLKERIEYTFCARLGITVHFGRGSEGSVDTIAVDGRRFPERRVGQGGYPSIRPRS